MDANDLLMENCRSNWREDARRWARNAAVANGLDPDDPSDAVRAFMADVAGARYRLLERLGTENIK